MIMLSTKAGLGAYSTFGCLLVYLHCLVICHASGNSMIANQDSRRLYDDLIGGYNRLVRPVSNNSDKLTVYMSLKLTQILDVVKIDFNKNYKILTKKFYSFGSNFFIRMKKIRLWPQMFGFDR